MELIKKDFEDSAQKLHTTNRYRHELELRYKAEKITQERLLKSIGDKDKLLDEQNRKILHQQDQGVKKDRRITELLHNIKDLKDDATKHVNKFTFEVNELKAIVSKTRIAAQESEDKFTKAEKELLENKQSVLTKAEQIKLLEGDKMSQDMRMKVLQETLQFERKEREEYEQRAHDNLIEMQKTSLELKEMLAVSRTLDKEKSSKLEQASKEK